jgi:hypothetical protein
LSVISGTDAGIIRGLYTACPRDRGHEVARVQTQQPVQYWTDIVLAVVVRAHDDDDDDDDDVVVVVVVVVVTVVV